eukprot:Gb_33536 [translate_table: standard]
MQLNIWGPIDVASPKRGECGSRRRGGQGHMVLKSQLLEGRKHYRRAGKGMRLQREGVLRELTPELRAPWEPRWGEGQPVLVLNLHLAKFDPQMTTDTISIDPFRQPDWPDEIIDSEPDEEVLNPSTEIMPGIPFQKMGAADDDDMKKEQPDPVEIGNNRNNGIHAGGPGKAKGSTKLMKQQSWSSELSRDEAWMRRKDAAKARKSKSLTDEDLEELRGCIDLGFGFSYEEDHKLCNTLPALDLYYAVNRQYIDCKSKSSPSTPECSFDRSSSCDGSPRSQLSETWRISSPGDNPQHVKTRLRHWAQVVACSVLFGTILLREALILQYLVMARSSWQTTVVQVEAVSLAINLMQHWTRVMACYSTIVIWQLVMPAEILNCY